MERKVLIVVGVILILVVLYAHNSTIRIDRHELDALSDQQRTMVNQAGSVQQKRESIERSIAELRSTLHTLQSQVSSLSSAIQTLELEMKEMDSGLLESHQAFQTLEQDMRSMEGGLQQSHKALSRITTAPLWNLSALDMAVIGIILLLMFWLMYRWYTEHRRLKVAAAAQKTELKVLEGRRDQPSATSTGTD